MNPFDSLCSPRFPRPVCSELQQSEPYFWYDEFDNVETLSDLEAFASGCYMNTSRLQLEPAIFKVPTPKTRWRGLDTKNKSDASDVVPTLLLACRAIQTKPVPKLLRCLLDSGSHSTLMHERCLPKGAVPTLLKDKQKIATLAGTFDSTRECILDGIVLPELDKNRRVETHSAYVFNGNCAYDIIAGRDFLRKAGLKLDFANGMIEWDDLIMPMLGAEERTADGKDAIEANFLDDEEDALELDEFLENFTTDSKVILDAKYEACNTDEMCRSFAYLAPDQREDLAALLRKHAKVFDGELRAFPGRKIHLELEPNATPVHARAYPVARVHEGTFYKELEHLCSIGVLSRIGSTEWASPTFIIPKKDGRVRWVSDFRALNKVLKRKKYPLPIIQDIIRRRVGYRYFTKLDISMQYYTFELDDESKELCTIVTPRGKYCYNRLPMGVKCSPDIAQEILEDILRDIEDTEVYIDDIGAFSVAWKEHICLLDRILTRLEENNFACNPLKCEWAIQETDWLGYWLTPNGLKPWKKKVDAVLKMQPPTSLKMLRGFIGAVNYYRDMFPRRAHVLKPLTDKVGCKTFEWTPAMQRAFDSMKSLLAQDVLMRYPNHNLPFEIYTDASDYQLGACIMQNNVPVAYYSKKLTPAQRNYTTMEKELLSIVMICKEFRSMLLGADLTFYTDHKNLTFANLNSQRVVRWRCFVEEYAPHFVYLPGKHNVLADTFSRLPRFDDTSASEKEGKKSNAVDAFYAKHDRSFYAELNLQCDFDEAITYEDRHTMDAFASILDDSDLFECFLHLPALEGLENPCTYQKIQEGQFEDAALNALLHEQPDSYTTKFFGELALICYAPNGVQDEQQWRIALPRASLEPVVRWYHKVLGHPGITRMKDTICARFYHPQLRGRIETYRCADCQRNKAQTVQWGELPPKLATLAPWSEVAVDLIGPWKVQIAGTMCVFYALTCIDPVTNFTELIRIKGKTSSHVRDKFRQSWLTRYPWPVRCIHDGGTEFTGEAFQRQLEMLGIKDVQITAYNPQANAVCERMHQTVGNVLRTLIYAHPPQNVEEVTELVDDALQTVSFALRASVSRALGTSSGALIFHRDMMMDVPFLADWRLLQSHRQELIDENLRRQNQKRRSHDYKVGDRVLLKAHKPNKLGQRARGPYAIRQVHCNGNVTIQKRPNVLERVNIRRIAPYRESAFF